MFAETIPLKSMQNTFQKSELSELYYQVLYVYTHKEFDLATGVSSAEESTDIVQTCMI